MPPIIDTTDALMPVRLEAQALPETVRTVTDTASFTAASTLLVRVKGVRTTIERLFAPHVARAFEAHRALLADRHRLDAPLAAAEATLKQQLAAFSVAETRRRRLEASAQEA